MMWGLLTQVITEGKAEATTYENLRAFTTTLQMRRTQRSQRLQDTSSALTGSINQLTADRESLDMDSEELNHIRSGKSKGAKAIGDFENAIAEVREVADMPQGHAVGFVSSLHGNSSQGCLDDRFPRNNFHAH